MKKVILFIMTATMMSLSAQDTIPLFDQSFYFPMSNRPYDSIIFDSLYASNPHTVCRGVDCYEYPPYHLHNDWYIAYRTTKTDNLYGFAITTDTLLPEDFTIILASVTAGSLGTITPIDTFNYNDFEYHKNMFYRYMWGFPVEKETVPCQILFFNQPVVVLDTFGIKIEPTSTKYRICEQTFSNHPITPDEIGDGGGGALGFQQLPNEGVCWHTLHIWGGIFPLRSLPCPPAAKPTVAESRQGLVRFNWWEGDTNLYQIAIK